MLYAGYDYFYRLVPPTLADGDQGHPRLNMRGALVVTSESSTGTVTNDASGNFTAAATYWTESVAVLAGAAPFNGTLRANGGAAGGVGTRFNFFVAEAFSDQVGTLYIDKSTDGGTTWRQVGSVASVANTSVTLKVPVSAASYRARFINGATLQTAFLLTSAYTTA